MKYIVTLWLFFISCLFSIADAKTDSSVSPNVLFIAVDDLNDWVGYLKGHPNAKTPNLDALAARGTYFTNAYTVSPICGPSRASVLTGMRPETTGIYHNKGMYKDYVPDAIALPKLLKDNGYYVMGAGKINHAMGMVVAENYHQYGPDAGAIGGPFTWQELSLTPGKEVVRKDILGQSNDNSSGIVKDVYPGKVIKRGALDAVLPLNGIDNTIDRPFNGYNTFDWGPVDVSDEQMPDGQIAAWAEQMLQREYHQPFFLGVGFYRPHQPFYAPRKYFEAFKGEDIALPSVVKNDLDDLSTVATHYAHFPWSGSFDAVSRHKVWQEGVLGYLASIHFADAQIGKVLRALDNSPHKDNTLIVLWSDHGWELGEKEHWGKHSPWQGSTRVPLIIVPPKREPLKQGAQGSFTSLLDIYPTIVDYAKLPVSDHLEGKSLKGLISGTEQQVRDYVVTTLGRASYALRYQHWKFIHYYDGSQELYDLDKDPNEWHNLAQKEKYNDMIVQLQKLIPVDKRFKQLVGYKHWKLTISPDDEVHLYNMLHPKSGIGEQDEVEDKHPEIVNEILTLLKRKGITERYVNLAQHMD